MPVTHLLGVLLLRPVILQKSDCFQPMAFSWSVNCSGVIADSPCNKIRI